MTNSQRILFDAILTFLFSFAPCDAQCGGCPNDSRQQVLNKIAYLIDSNCVPPDICCCEEYGTNCTSPNQNFILHIVNGIVQGLVVHLFVLAFISRFHSSQQQPENNSFRDNIINSSDKLLSPDSDFNVLQKRMNNETCFKKIKSHSFLLR